MKFKKIPPRVLGDSPRSQADNQDWPSYHVTSHMGEKILSQHASLGWGVRLCSAALLFLLQLLGWMSPSGSTTSTLFHFPCCSSHKQQRVWTLSQAMVAPVGLSDPKHKTASAGFPRACLAFSGTSLKSEKVNDHISSITILRVQEMFFAALCGVMWCSPQNQKGRVTQVLSSGCPHVQALRGGPSTHVFRCV